MSLEPYEKRGSILSLSVAINRLLSADFHIGGDVALHRRVTLTSTLLIVTLIVFPVFFFININNGNKMLAVIDVGMFIFMLFPTYALFIHKNINMAAYSCSAILFIFLIYFTYTHKNESFGLVWTYAFPVYIMPMLGARKGIVAVFVFYLLIMPISYLGIGEWNHGNWNLISFERFLISSLFFAGMGCLSEVAFMRADEKLILARKREESHAENLRKLSITDQLTGLYNRRYFDERFSDELKRLQRYKYAASLIIADIDFFKLVNDTYGHQAGDHVLQEVSLIMQSTVRETDFIARWGGEEFVIFLPETNAENAIILAEKIRLLVSEKIIERVGTVKMSFGVTDFDHTAISTDSIIQRADKALYQAKKEGRNHVVLFPHAVYS